MCEKSSNNDKWFDSELVSFALVKNGTPIIDEDVGEVSPERVAKSPLLSSSDHVNAGASDEPGFDWDGVIGGAFLVVAIVLFTAVMGMLS